MVQGLRPLPEERTRLGGVHHSPLACGTIAMLTSKLVTSQDAKWHSELGGDTPSRYLALAATPVYNYYQDAKCTALDKADSMLSTSDAVLGPATAVLEDTTVLMGRVLCT